MRTLALLLSLAVAGWADEAGRLARDARRAERQGDDLRAYTLYTRAAGLRPQQEKYRFDAVRLQVRAAQSLAALDRLDEALALDPENPYLQARQSSPQKAEPAPPTTAEVREAEQAAEPIELKPKPGARSFHLKGNTHEVWQQVARAYGLEVVFDPDFTPGSPFQFHLENAEVREAFRSLRAVTGTFLAPIHERVALVAKDTPPKRNEFEPMMATLLPIPQVISVEEANEVGRAVQQALDIKRLAVDAARRQVYLRDTVTKVHMARLLYEDLSRRRGEVMIEIELIAASKSSLANLGLTLPTSFPATPGSSGLFTVGGGQTIFGVQVADPAFQANRTRSDSQLLTSFRIRATDGLPASMHIGDKYPIVNALFSPVVITDQIQNLQNSGQYRQPFPSFTFEDLGLVLKVTPRIHDLEEVSLTIEAEFRLLSGASLNGIPVISDRKFNSAVRLKEGETSIVSGLAVAQSARTQSGVAGLSQLPFIGSLWRQNTYQIDQNELLIAITPRLTIAPPAEQAAPLAFYFGSELRPVGGL
ncbi:MAG: type II and III secretion system protein [Acidobacteria bacterium]|nr:type II and III secretion system protein [Acidobacteriota bacterium]